MAGTYIEIYRYQKTNTSITKPPNGGRSPSNIAGWHDISYNTPLTIDWRRIYIIKTPRISPSGGSYRVSILKIWEKINRVMTTPHYRLCIGIRLYRDKWCFMCHSMFESVWWLLMAWCLFGAIMMTSSNGDIFRVTGHLCGEFIGPPLCEFPTQRPVTRSFEFSLICVWINGWVNNGEAGDLRRYRTHYDVTVMDISYYHDDIDRSVHVKSAPTWWIH